MSDYRVESIDLAAGGAVEASIELGSAYRTITVLRHDGLLEVKPNQGAPWIPLYHAGQVLHFGTPTKKLYYQKAAGLTGVVDLFFSLDGSWIQLNGGMKVAGVSPQLDDADKLAISMWATDGATPGKNAVRASSAGRVFVSALKAEALGDTQALSPASTFDTTDLPRVPIVAPYRFNGSVWDRSYNNVESTLLPAAVRNANTDSALQSSPEHKGAAFFLNVTANPGGAETLELQVMAYAPTPGAPGPYISSGPFVAATSGIFMFFVYPGVIAADFLYAGVRVGKAGVLPRRWIARVVHSAGGNWNYSLDASTIL